MEGTDNVSAERGGENAKGDERRVEIDAVVIETSGEEIVVVEIVDIEQCGRENRKPPPAKHYKVKIDHDYFTFDQRIVTGRELLQRAGKIPPERYEIEKRVHGGEYVPVGLDQRIDLGEPGIEVFETFPLDETEG